MSEQQSVGMPDKFDRTLGLLDGLPGMAHTKQASIRVVPPLGVGGSASYNVQTYRQAGDVVDEANNVRTPATFTVFLEVVEGDRAIRIVLPNEVANLIARQRDALTAQAQRKSAQRAAETRKARGFVPVGFKKRRKKHGE